MKDGLAKIASEDKERGDPLPTLTVAAVTLKWERCMEGLLKYRLAVSDCCTHVQESGEKVYVGGDLASEEDLRLDIQSVRVERANMGLTRYHIAEQRSMATKQKKRRRKRRVLDCTREEEREEGEEGEGEEAEEAEEAEMERMEEGKSGGGKGVLWADKAGKSLTESSDMQEVRVVDTLCSPNDTSLFFVQSTRAFIYHDIMCIDRWIDG